MILLMDLGNTRLKWATFADGQLASPAALVHRGDGMPHVLDTLCRVGTTPRQVYLASVAADETRGAVAQWIESHWGCPVVLATSASRACGVVNGYTDPAQLGVDRWLALIGAWRRLGRAVCVVDCGSALTVDILDARGHHQGGLIMPGWQLLADALHRGTALPASAAREQLKLGRDTQAAMAAGRASALLGAVDWACRQAPTDARLVLTGGGAPRLIELLDRPNEYRPDLVLEGLAATLDGA